MVFSGGGSGSGVRVGYARISPHEQDGREQLDALAGAGCAPVIVETAGLRDPKPRLAQAVHRLGAGDLLVVHTPDRIAVSVKDLLQLLHDRLRPRGAGLHLLAGSGAGVHHRDEVLAWQGGLLQVAAMATEVEAALARERAREQATADDAAGGRGQLNEQTLAAARARAQAGEGIPAIARDLKIGRSALYRALLDDTLPVSGDEH